MQDRLLYFGVLGVLLASTLAVGLTGSVSDGPAAPDVDSDQYRTTQDGTRYVVHPSELRQGCPGGKDCIPAIDDPRFQSSGEASWLADDDLVIGIERNGEARAYPLRILNVHEIVNDEIGGEPVAVTYCPLCRSGVVFSRTVRGETLTFGVSGKLLDANLVMYDRQTGTYWGQIRGAAIVGTLVPTELDQIPNSLTTWGEWREANSDTEVLSRDTGIYPPNYYGSNPYSDYADSDRVGFGVDNTDNRLPSKDIVYGLSVGNASRAYPESTVEREGVINDRIDGFAIVVFDDPESGSVMAFEREIDGQSYNFTFRDGLLVDEEGTEWTITADGLDGPDDRQLGRLNPNGFYWFAWSAHNPGTDIHGR